MQIEVINAIKKREREDNLLLKKSPTKIQKKNQNQEKELFENSIIFEKIISIFPCFVFDLQNQNKRIFITKSCALSREVEDLFCCHCEPTRVRKQKKKNRKRKANKEKKNKRARTDISRRFFTDIPQQHRLFYCETN